MHRKVAVAIAAALALVVTSCGGSETTTLGRAELVRRVELACREAQSASMRQARAAGRSANPVAALRAGQRVLVDKLEEVEASGAARADYVMFKEALRTRYDAIERVMAASSAEKERVLRSVQADAEAASRKLDTAARNLGIEGCN